MGVHDWTFRDIDPEQDYWLWEAAKITRINIVTLKMWRREQRLCVYPNPQLTTDEWLIEAIRMRPTPLTKAEIKKRHRQKWPGRAKARQAVTRALIKGTLIPGPCDICGTTKAIEAHHEDYSKLLDVRWLCHEHHRWVHRKNANTKTVWGSAHRIERNPQLQEVT